MATKYMCISEDEIAFWGVLFPKTERQPRNVVRMEYAGKPLRINVYEYDLSIRNRCCSIEQVFTEDEMLNVPEWEGLVPKKVKKDKKSKGNQVCVEQEKNTNSYCVRGYKMAWYGFLETNPVIRLLSFCIRLSCFRGASSFLREKGIWTFTLAECRICLVSTA